MGFNFLKGNDETICNLLFVCVFFYSSGLFLFLVDGTAGEGACAAAASRSGKELRRKQRSGRWRRRDVNGIQMTLDGDSVLYSIRQTGYNRLRFPSGEMAELV